MLWQKLFYIQQCQYTIFFITVIYLDSLQSIMASKYSDFRKVAKNRNGPIFSSGNEHLNEIDKMLESFKIPVISPNQPSRGVNQTIFNHSFSDMQMEKGSDMGETCDLTINIDSEFGGHRDASIGKISVMRGQHRRNYTQCSAGQEEKIYHKCLGRTKNLLDQSEDFLSEDAGLKSDEGQEQNERNECLLEKLRDLEQKILKKKMGACEAKIFMDQLSSLQQFLDKN